MSKVTVADLVSKIEALEQRLAVLETKTQPKAKPQGIVIPQDATRYDSFMEAGVVAKLGDKKRIVRDGEKFVVL